jgi:hypothetical protein
MQRGLLSKMPSLATRLVVDGSGNNYPHTENDAKRSEKESDDAKRQEQAVEWRVLIDGEVYEHSQESDACPEHYDER